METFFVKPRIYMDDGWTVDLLKGKTKALIITDGFMSKSGMTDFLTVPLMKAGIEYRIFDEVKPDPDIATITRGVSLISEFAPDLLFALGGGSPIDAAKAVNYLSWKGGMGKKCCFAAVPTTSGTGSEVTSFAVISDPVTKSKYPLISDDMLPDAAILDARLTESVPASITADTGIDVFTHAVEAFVSKNNNDFTDAAAEKAVKLVRSNLLTAYRDPHNLTARQKMHHASCLAGMAFSNAGLGLNHGMAHTLGAHFHIPHGKANAMLLPYVMSFNCGCQDGLREDAKRYARLARACFVESGTVRQSAFNMIRSTKQLIRNLGFPESLREMKIDEREYKAALDEMAEAALADRCTETNPRVPTGDDIKEIFMEAYIGRTI